MKHGRVEEVETPEDPPDLVIADAALTLADVLHGPYSGLATAEAAVLAAEAVRYLNYAPIHGEVAGPAEVTPVSTELSTAAYRVPQLLGPLRRLGDRRGGADR